MAIFFWPFSFSFSQQVIESVDESTSPKYLLDTFLNIKYDEDGMTFSADQLLPRISEEFSGALFVCNPFCQVVGVKLDEGWKPDLATVSVNSKNIKLMDVDDPLFAILFAEKKEAAAVVSRSRKARRERTKVAQAAKTQAAEKAVQAARIPKTAFDSGFRYGINSSYGLISQKSDSNVQSDFILKSGLINADLTLGYYRGKPMRFLGRWLQFELGFDQTLFGTKSSLENGEKLDLSRNKMYFITWVRSSGYSWGLKLSQVKQNYKVSQNALTAFSFNEDSQYVGLAYKYKRYRLDIDYGLGYKISEQQPFRDKLNSSDQFSLEGMYCPTRYTIAGTELTPCYGGSYLYTNNQATFNPAISPTGEVKLTRHDIAVFMNIYFGEDFLR
jgi:hypothetical protein